MLRLAFDEAKKAGLTDVELIQNATTRKLKLERAHGARTKLVGDVTKDMKGVIDVFDQQRVIRHLDTLNELSDPTQADSVSIVDGPEFKAARGRAEQFLDDVKKAKADLESVERRWISGLPEDLSGLSEAIERALAQSQTVGGQEGPLKGSWEKCDAVRGNMESRRSAENKLREQLNAALGSLSESLEARRVVVSSLRDALEEARKQRADGTLVKAAEKQLKRLDLVSRTVISSNEISGLPQSLDDDDYLASGAMGQIRTVTFQGETIAAKIFKYGRGKKERADTEAALRKETLVLTRLQGPNIVSFRGVVTDWILGGILLLDYFQDGSLRNLINRAAGDTLSTRLCEESAFALALDIAKGMAQMHRLGFIHGDLKGANVLVETQKGAMPPEQWVAKLADFGSVAAATTTSLTSFGAADENGTTPWYAPERRAGARPSYEVDVFAFGVVLWEMLSGKMPSRRYEVDTAECVAEDAPRFLKDLMTLAARQEPSERPTFDAIVHMCTERGGRWRESLVAEIEALSEADRVECFCAIDGSDRAAVSQLLRAQQVETLTQLLASEARPRGGVKSAVRQSALRRLSQWVGEVFGGRGASHHLKEMREAAFVSDEDGYLFECVAKPLPEMAKEFSAQWRALRQMFAPPPLQTADSAAEARGLRLGQKRVILVLRAGFNPSAMNFMPGGGGRTDVGGEWHGYCVEITAGNADDMNDDDVVAEVAARIRELHAQGTLAAIAAGSRGGTYLAMPNGLWDQMKRGELPKVPTFLINNAGKHTNLVHNPSFVMPGDVPIIMTHGSREGYWAQDEDTAQWGAVSGWKMFVRLRGVPTNGAAHANSLEGLLNNPTIAESRAQRFLYYSGDSGGPPVNSATVAPWSRVVFNRGDDHNPTGICEDGTLYGSLATYLPATGIGDSSKQGVGRERSDALLRLFDALTSGAPVENAFIASSRQLLSQARQEHEANLGLTPSELPFAKDQALRPLAHDAPPVPATEILKTLSEASSEYKDVRALFFDDTAPSWYHHNKDTLSSYVDSIVKIERIQNRDHMRQVNERLRAIQEELTKVGIPFAKGVHTRWAFHGAPRASIESVARDPTGGFKSTLSGSATGEWWGKGVYFGRDARFPVLGTGAARYSTPDDEGSCRVMLCQLMTGLSCAADGEMRIFPYYTGGPDSAVAVRYHSSIDALANPEIFVLQDGVAICPAYVVTFKLRQ